MQHLLNQYGYKLEEDGKFGAKTQAAVKDYQSKNNLTVDGIAGSKTMQELKKLSAEDNKQQGINNNIQIPIQKPNPTKTPILTTPTKAPIAPTNNQKGTNNITTSTSSPEAIEKRNQVVALAKECASANNIVYEHNSAQYLYDPSGKLKSQVKW